MGQLEDTVYLSTWLATSVPRLAEIKNYLNSRMREPEARIKVKYDKKVDKAKRKTKPIGDCWTNVDQRQLEDFFKIINLCALIPRNV
eukprot:snap_masked-scaffold_23-processed-gene-1.26-mRNA-1 protein AED:1.00 eAED:1.00 QI:0/-1/0/0/-1/1/1/0/86